MKKLTINLPVLLPDIPDVEDRCVTQLIGTLEGREGIHRVHVKMDDEEMSLLLCIHFDSDVISLRYIKHIVPQPGRHLQITFDNLLTEVSGISHPSQGL